MSIYLNECDGNTGVTTTTRQQQKQRRLSFCFLLKFIYFYEFHNDCMWWWCWWWRIRKATTTKRNKRAFVCVLCTSIVNLAIYKMISCYFIDHPLKSKRMNCFDFFLFIILNMAFPSKKVKATSFFLLVPIA